ncbi:NAD(P)/FAD-dependent oxidoreductase [Streptomyces sp. NPDC002476]|uniref:NAD(P)/FAD-dependent oxidoreductase n=1 Tax=Streptomyces sp. NPDC002476 TaxID=3364648 RepID=UPI003679E0DE
MRRSLDVVIVGAGERNLLVSDKVPGPELELALHSAALWQTLAQELPSSIEYERKGGLVVAQAEDSLAGLSATAAGQRRAGVEAYDLTAGRLREIEPHLAPGPAGGCLYPQDAQVQPALAAAELLRSSVRAGACLWPGEEVVAILADRAGAVSGVRTARCELRAPVVVNAAGTWGGEVAALAGTPLPVMPRRGFVLVTEPLPRLIRHKVYAAEYVAYARAPRAVAANPGKVGEGVRYGAALARAGVRVRTRRAVTEVRGDGRVGRR